MTAALADRTDWRAGLGNAIPSTNQDVRQYVSELTMGSDNISWIPALIGIAGTGSLAFNAVLPLPIHVATTAPATEWNWWADAIAKRSIEVAPTAAQQLAQELRRRSGLTNEEIAPLAGVSRRSFQAWLAGGAISARKEMRLRQLVDALALIGEADPQEMRASLLDKGKGTVRPYDLLAEGRFSVAVSLATGQRIGVAKSWTTQIETLAQQFDRDQGSLPESGGRLNRSLSKPLRR
jgi:hypothetical protein